MLPVLCPVARRLLERVVCAAPPLLVTEPLSRGYSSLPAEVAPWSLECGGPQPVGAARSLPGAVGSLRGAVGSLRGAVAASPGCGLDRPLEGVVEPPLGLGPDRSPARVVVEPPLGLGPDRSPARVVVEPAGDATDGAGWSPTAIARASRRRCSGLRLWGLSRPPSARQMRSAIPLMSERNCAPNTRSKAAWAVSIPSESSPKCRRRRRRWRRCCSCRSAGSCLRCVQSWTW